MSAQDLGGYLGAPGVSDLSRRQALPGGIFFLQLRLRLPAPPAIPFHHLLWLVGDRSCCSFCISAGFIVLGRGLFLEFRPCGLLRPF